MTYLDSAYRAWTRMAPLREARRRCKRFAYGRQWSEPAAGADGRSEGQQAADAGHTPLTNNMIRQLVKCVVGTFRERLPSSGMADDDDYNQLGELDARMLEEFLISGCALQRVSEQKRPEGTGVWVDNVNPDCFFVNDFRDPRGTDITCIGMLHAMTRGELLMRFGADERAVSAISRGWGKDMNGDTGFAPMSAMSMLADSAGDGSSDTPVSFFEAPPGRLRVIELWTLESLPVLRCHDKAVAEAFLCPAAVAPDLRRLNRRRAKAAMPPIDSNATTTLRWVCRWLSPTGVEIACYTSPYRHCSHPFAVKLYPLIDGEVHSLVEDIIDQQRHINRLITLIDHILSVSAKGALLFPTEAKPADMSWSEIAERWARCGAVIPFDSRRTGSSPTQIVTAGENTTAFQLLDLNMRLFQQISGVSDALQGRLPAANTSAALYDSQIRSATTALRDLLDTFDSFRQARDRMMKRV